VLVRLVTTLAAWLVAYLIVFALLVTFGHELESLPPALDALVFTGVLVPVMGNLVMPVLGAAVARRLAGPRAHESTSAPDAEAASSNEPRKDERGGRVPEELAASSREA